MDQIALRASAERPAIIADGATLTYGDLMERVSTAAAWLDRRKGFRRDGVSRVGLDCGNGVEYIVLALAILKTGGCLVPLADELTEPERQEIITRTGLCGIVTGTPGGPEWQSLDTPELENEAAFSALDPAFIRFSSGTTGRSKGVVLSHAKLRERITAANAALEIGPHDKVLWMLPMAHHFAVSIVLYLYHGACTVLGSSHLATEVLELARTTRATVIYGAPFHHSLLAADDGGYAWPDLRLAVTTAAPLPEALAGHFKKRFGKPLVQGLGIIEIGLPLLNTGGAGDSPTAVGRPLPAYDVELRDDEGLPVAIGKTGELWIKGPGMFDAYLSPWQTVDEICVDGWFATGDLAETDAAGRIYLRGRKKSVLNVSGMKVFPEEIEAAIERHPAVKRCRVAGMPHTILGTVPAAEVILENGEVLKPRQLIEWCRKSLSIYKVPVHVKFVSNLPLTASGKIRRV
ncbi:AMP-binding protein [Luteolibacter yonseiensis]|uniref:AMP-binding protein n=1 Tax=Luteolibacter yonseiensis TaxID=1144680 RepID=A0A934V779_9BACT|nr:AMP-binding protein [Luteolibacter yonseiensis]MBK1815857.1 AMP-binding protein [Luteolibacter yonseiensis]